MTSIPPKPLRLPVKLAAARLPWRSARVGWLVAAAALLAGLPVFCPFLSEFCNAERDLWMMVPAIGAAWYRLRRVETGRAEHRSNGWLFGTAVAEGMIWALAVWIKPHVVFVAAACWAASAMRI